MERIILFDGFCNLCNSSVQFIIKHDKKEAFKFAPLQSESGKSLLSKYNIQSNNFDSIVYIRDNKYYVKSAAVLYILKDLRGGWKFLFGFIVIPRFLRDFIYNLVAKSRYRIFGKRIDCEVTMENQQHRFLL